MHLLVAILSLDFVALVLEMTALLLNLMELLDHFENVILPFAVLSL